MDAFVIFSIICFVVYIQAGIYAFWRNPFIGVNNLFSLMTVLFAIWSLAYVFSYMGEVGRSLFPLPEVTLAGLAFLPAFYIRIFMSLNNYPEKGSLRNVVFITVLSAGTAILLIGRYDVSPLYYRESTVLSNPTVLFLITLTLFLVNAYIFTQLQFFVIKPNLFTRDIMNQADLLYVVCDNDKRVVDSNEFTCNLLGCELFDVKGISLKEFVSEEDELHFRFEKAIKEGRSGPFDTFWVSSSQEDIPVHLEFHGLVDLYGDIHGVVIMGEDKVHATKIMNDIQSSEKTQQYLKTASQHLKQLIDEYSHELADIQKDLYAYYGESSQNLIKSGFEERETLIGEIHDRVIANMNLAILLINAHIKEHLSGPLNKSLTDLSQRVRAMLLVHEFLYFSINYSEVDFKGFLYKLVEEIKTEYFKGTEVGIHFDISDSFLSIQRAIPLGIIASELVTNCFQHAFRASVDQALIHIAYQNETDLIQLKVKDNGVGISGKFIIGGFQSAGLILVETLVKDQLDGSFEITNESGTVATIAFSATE